jgi:release factor glutamine methyltransferase
LGRAQYAAAAEYESDAAPSFLGVHLARLVVRPAVGSTCPAAIVEVGTALATEVVAALRSAGCVFAEDEARLMLADARDSAELTAMVRRRSAGEPLEHVLGWAEFCGLRIALTHGVFVPRRRSELLVREALARAGTNSVVLELCCGSGAVGLALLQQLAAAGRPAAELHAADVDAAAVLCAGVNLASAAGRISQVYQGDLFAALPTGLRGRVDLLVVNAPYVPTPAMRFLPPEARLHEPRRALDGGADGADTQRRVAADAANWLAAGGHLLIQTSQEQTALTAAIVANGRLRPTIVVSADLEAAVVIGTREGCALKSG